MRKKKRTMSSHLVPRLLLLFNLSFAQTEYAEHSESKVDQQVHIPSTWKVNEAIRMILWLPREAFAFCTYQACFCLYFVFLCNCNTTETLSFFKNRRRWSLLLIWHDMILTIGSSLIGMCFLFGLWSHLKKRLHHHDRNFKLGQFNGNVT